MSDEVIAVLRRIRQHANNHYHRGESPPEFVLTHDEHAALIRAMQPWRGGPIEKITTVWGVPVRVG